MKNSEIRWAELGVGRTGPVRCCYILSKPKPTLTDVPDKYIECMQSILLSPESSLVEQEKKLHDNPDLIILKCHKFVMSKAAQTFMRNITEFMDYAGHRYNMMQVIPFQVQCDLADRFAMISLLEDVCAAANRFQLGKHAVPLALNVESSTDPSTGNQVWSQAPRVP